MPTDGERRNCSTGFPGEKEVFDFLDLFREEKPYVKIGMELFYALGPNVVREIKARGHKIFLDLKLHDIPNTVRSAMASLSKLDVDMTNLHAAGGSRMMAEALTGLTRPGRHPAAADCRDPADLHLSGDVGKGTAH